MVVVTPEEGRAAMTGAGLAVGETVGVSFSPLSGRWSLTKDASVNYMLVGKRP
jgi:2-polyprenyl-6-hydroxyphenyl methylase/3-demethylubiquinone-9 3-methyltransferase